MRRIQFAFLLLAVAITALPDARAQRIELDANVVWAESAGLDLIPESIELAALQGAVDGADSLVVPLRRLSFSLSAETVELTQLRVYRFESDDAVRDFGNILTYFDASTDTLTIERAVVIDAEGRIHTIDPSTVQVLSSDTLSVFGDGKVLVIPLAGLEVGATAIIADKTVTRRDRDVGPWGVVLNQQYGVPQDRLEISLTWSTPDLRPMWHSGLESMSCNESAAGLNCVALNILPYPTDENANYDDIIPQFVIAEQNSWEEIRDWYRPLFDSALASDAAIRSTAERLVRDADTEVDKLRAIHRFVATEIRYLGLEHGDSAFVPHATDTTLARRYGDCKDKSALLIDLLRQVGIEMEPVLVATSRRDPGKLVVPTRNYFDHMIVCGTLSNGQSYCLDATDPYAGIATLNRWIQGAVALELGGAGGLARLPEDSYSWVIREDLGLELGADGGLIERSSVEYGGTYGITMRGGLANLSSQELSEWAVDDYHDAVNPDVDPAFEFAGIDDIDAPVSISWEVTYENLLQSTLDLNFVEAMSWLNQALNGLATTNDVFHYRFAGLQFDSLVTVQVDETWRVESTGPTIDMQSPFGSFRRSYSSNGRTVEIRTEFSAPAAVIEVAEIPAFNRFLDIVSQEGLMHVRGPLQ